MSKFMEWSAALSVGVDELDSQHKVLVGLVNELHEALTQGREREVLDAVLTRLVEYTRIHFAVEESLMRLLGYPGLDAHMEEHRALIARLNALRRKADAGDATVSIELMDFLKLWLTSHIMESDQRYARHFVEVGVAPTLRQRSQSARFWDHLRD